MAADSPILLQKDNTFTKLFVGGLPYHTTDETLRAHFLQFGEIEEAVVIHDRITRKSKGYGFVTMADKEAAERACVTPNPVIEGRRANVNLAYLGAKPKMSAYPPDGQLAGLNSPTGADQSFFPQHSPPPLPFGIQTQGFIIPGPGCPPFSPPPPPLLGPFPFIPPQFNPGFGYGPPFFQGPMNMNQFPLQAMPPLVPYNVAN